MHIVLIAKAVICDPQGVLLYQRSFKRKYNPGGFSFPGGHVESGEEIIRAAVREAKEETNLDVEPIEVIAADHYPGIDKGRINLSVAVLCRNLGTSPLKLNDEGNAAHWIKDISKFRLDEKNARIAETALAYWHKNY